MSYKIISDIHGKYRQYHKIIEDCEGSIQLGDLGLGFYRSDGSSFPNPSWDKMVKGNHRFLVGNHDNKSVARNHSQWIPDGHTEVTEKGNKLFFCGGAWSIDRAWRTEGLDWWPDEELSYSELLALVDKFAEYKPDVVFTHDFPQSVSRQLFLHPANRQEYPTRTGQALQNMFERHQPKIWCGAHWHENRDEDINGTHFICLEELGTINLDI